MALILDPRYPLVWRTPHSLQLGVDRPPVILEDVGLGHERLLAALTIGVSASGLDLIGESSGMSKVEMARFRRVIDPVLLDRSSSPTARISVAGRGSTVDRILRLLGDAGLEAVSTGPAPGTALSTEDPSRIRLPNAIVDHQPDLAVIVGHFVIAPGTRSHWLRRDTPHLPIVYGDTSARIGPIIEPGAGPCLYCLELHHRDEDPAWPTLASQLLGKQSSAESGLLPGEVAAIAARMIVNRTQEAARHPAIASSGAATESAPSGTDLPDAMSPDTEPVVMGPLATESVTVDARTGTRTFRRLPSHPDCGCGGIEAVNDPVRPGSASASLRPSAGRSTPPTTSGAASVPA